MLYPHHVFSLFITHISYECLHIFSVLACNNSHYLHFPRVSHSRDPSVGLKSLYEFVRSSLSSTGEGREGADDTEEWGPPVLLVDDLSVLLSLGVSAGAVLDFSHYCRATVCSQLQVCKSHDLKSLHQHEFYFIFK